VSFEAREPHSVGIVVFLPVVQLVQQRRQLRLIQVDDLLDRDAQVSQGVIHTVGNEYTPVNTV
jgi:hypothetical protein